MVEISLWASIRAHTQMAGCKTDFLYTMSVFLKKVKLSEKVLKCDRMCLWKKKKKKTVKNKFINSLWSLCIEIQGLEANEISFLLST